MADNNKQLAAKRLDKFRIECKERNIPALNTSENTRLKTIFVNDLSEKYGKDIQEATFDDILPDLMGSGITPIEQYIQSLSDEFPFLGEEPAPEEQPNISEVPDPPTENEDEIENAKHDMESRPSDEGQKQERQTRTRKKNTSSNDIFWSPATSARGNTKKARELRKQISVIAKDRDILHRQFSVYRQDYAIIQGILEYGKKGSKPLECNGLSLDNHQNVIHAALENLIRDLEASGNTECFQNIKKFREMAKDEVAYFNEKISKLDKELQKLTEQ